jgi:hypothetical protein
MRIFRCDHCAAIVPFAASECGRCGVALGYVPDDRRLRELSAVESTATFLVPGHEAAMWRCLNAAWGCNWMLPAGGDSVWCRSCELTRGRPDVDRQDSIEAWMTAEAAKRRLVHELDALALPMEPRSDEAPDGLAFDLVHVPGETGVTGHRDGIVTLDLAEADDRHREAVRRQFDEPFRTVIGHLRHEIGHHYWNRLVGQTDHLAHFRRLFGDERVDYGNALDAHYATLDGGWDEQRFVTSYAAAHPLEDWAESFAHYLHIVDATDTAAAHDLLPGTRVAFDLDEPCPSPEFAEILAMWQPIADAVNDIAASLGVPAVYPFAPTGIVADKLAFVHHQVVAHSVRDRFYADR